MDRSRAMIELSLVSGSSPVHVFWFFFLHVCWSCQSGWRFLPDGGVVRFGQAGLQKGNNLTDRHFIFGLIV